MANTNGERARAKAMAIAFTLYPWNRVYRAIHIQLAESFSPHMFSCFYPYLFCHQSSQPTLKGKSVTLIQFIYKRYCFFLQNQSRYRYTIVSMLSEPQKQGLLPFRTRTFSSSFFLPKQLLLLAKNTTSQFLCSSSFNLLQLFF